MTVGGLRLQKPSETAVQEPPRPIASLNPDFNDDLVVQDLVDVDPRSLLQDPLHRPLRILVPLFLAESCSLWPEPVLRPVRVLAHRPRPDRQFGRVGVVEQFLLG